MKKILYLLLIFICLLSACKNKQQTGNQQAIADTIVVQQATTPITVAANIKNFDYQWYSTRMNISVSYINPKKNLIAINAFIVNKKDSIIFINISKFAIEGARIVLTPDSVKYVNHLDQQYYWGSYAWLSKKMGFEINFQTIQALLIAQDIPNFENNFTKDSTAEGILYYSQVRKNNNNQMLIEESILTDTKCHLLKNDIKDIATFNTLHIAYGQYTSIENQDCYQTLKVEIPTMNILLDGILKSTKINVEGPTTIRLPQKYSPLQLK